MPRIVDRAQRELEVTDAALRILRRDGPRGLTLRALAKELDGSITLVTHFYSTRSDLLASITRRLVADYQRELESLVVGANPQARLRILLEWLLPLTNEAKLAERSRVLMSAERGTDLNVQAFFKAMEDTMRGLLREHLAGLVPPDEVEIYVDTLRAFANGVVLSAIEHPRYWTKKRQSALLDFMFRRLGLDHPASEGIREDKKY
jgi:AcrR family transcriptional regulator